MFFSLQNRGSLLLKCYVTEGGTGPGVVDLQTVDLFNVVTGTGVVDLLSSCL